MIYVYVCHDCSVPEDQRLKKEHALCDYETEKNGWHPKTHEYTFFIESSMKDMQQHPTCPKCESKDTDRTFVDANCTSYIRGNCYLDKVGAKRDMHVHKLQNEDPYGHMRVSGEKEHMIAKFKNAGRDMVKIREKGLKAISARKKEVSEKTKLELASITGPEKQIIKFINDNETYLRAGVSFERLPKLHDINKVLSELIKRGYVYTKGDNRFVLLAEGRWAAGEI